MTTSNFPFFCSWSGGKDSCLALYRAIQAGGEPRSLFTMFTEGGERSRSHGLQINVIKRQAEALNLPIVVQSASWASYEETFIAALGRYKQEGFNHGVFGDIDMQHHRQWVEKVCAVNNIKPHLPLWLESRRALVTEFIDLGFKALIVAAKDGVLDRKYLGRPLTKDIIQDFENLGIDAAGEEGEYHTVVTDGPIFTTPVKLTLKEQVLRDGYWFLDVSV